MFHPLEDANTNCLRPFDALTNLEFHALTSIEIAKTVPLYLGVMDARISSAALLLDEAEALLPVAAIEMIDAAPIAGGRMPHPARIQ